MSVYFRKIQNVDHDQVISFVTEIADSQQVPGFNWNEKNLRSEFSYAKCFVLEDQGKVLGFLAVRSLPDAEDITCIVVRTKNSSQGLGRLLLTEYISYLSNNAQSRASDIWLEVHAHNQRAFRFYTQFGFKCVGNRKNYYPDGGDALLLSLKRS